MVLTPFSISSQTFFLRLQGHLHAVHFILLHISGHKKFQMSSKPVVKLEHPSHNIIPLHRTVSFCTIELFIQLILENK